MPASSPRPGSAWPKRSRTTRPIVPVPTRGPSGGSCSRRAGGRVSGSGREAYRRRWLAAGRADRRRSRSRSGCALGRGGDRHRHGRGQGRLGRGVTRLIEAIPPRTQAYVEIPIDRDPAPLIAAIGRAGGRAKVRTGGVTADAFPAAGDLVRFIRGLPRRGRAVQGDRGPAPSASRRVPADLPARQPVRDDVRLPESSFSPRRSCRRTRRRGRRAVAGGTRSRRDRVRRRRGRMAGPARSISPRSRQARERGNRLVRVLLLHRADRRPPSRWDCSSRRGRDSRSLGSTPGWSPPTAPATSRFRTFPSACSGGAVRRAGASGNRHRRDDPRPRRLPARLVCFTGLAAQAGRGVRRTRAEPPDAARAGCTGRAAAAGERAARRPTRRPMPPTGDWATGFSSPSTTPSCSCRPRSATTPTSTPRSTTPPTSAACSAPTIRCCPTTSGSRSAITAGRPPSCRAARRCGGRSGQTQGPDAEAPVLRAQPGAGLRDGAGMLRRARGNQLGEPVPIARAEEHIFGLLPGERLVGPRHPGLGVPAARSVSGQELRDDRSRPGW